MHFLNNRDRELISEDYFYLINVMKMTGVPAPFRSYLQCYIFYDQRQITKLAAFNIPDMYNLVLGNEKE